MSEKKDHKVTALNLLNDAEEFILITDKDIAVQGEYSRVVGLLAAAIASSENIREIVLGATELVVHETKKR